MTEQQIRTDERDEIMYLLESLEPAKDYSTGYSSLMSGWEDGIQDATEAIRLRHQQQKEKAS